MAQRKELDELQEIARVATHEALEEFQPLPAEWQKGLTLGAGIDAEYGVFELYVTSEQPENAIVISSARVHRKTRAVEVTISNLIKLR
jgi:hypothetical protein